jgi:hypothetical protein
VLGAFLRILSKEGVSSISRGAKPLGKATASAQSAADAASANDTTLATVS